MALAKIHAVDDAAFDNNPSFDELRSVIVAETSQRGADSIDLTALLFAPEVFALGNASNMRVHVEGAGDLIRCYGREHSFSAQPPA
ncbi:hypothetical protein [Bradyrhizobium sp. Leo121]|uniref:hypothetical protein n=1 Tax=Bradyrhizobium sp. Leo121 TaxID=1571195 RepID=UPI001028E581|nr:hypothetical protein [Bradyrhizobium sp. Leo121]